MEKRYTEGHIIGFLHEAEAGIPVKELCSKYGFSEASYDLWHGKFGGMSVPDAKRLRELETDPVRAAGDHRDFALQPNHKPTRHF